jgi:hypothetical protein
MRSPRSIRLCSLPIALALAAGLASAQTAPPFWQTFVSPIDWDGREALYDTREFDTATYDTSVTFMPGQPTSELHFSGSTVHWALDLIVYGRTFYGQGSLDCDPVFMLYGLGAPDSVTLRVRVAAKFAVLYEGTYHGMEQGRVAIFTPTVRDSLDVTHYMDGAGTYGHPPITVADTLEIPVVVHGDTRLFSFHVNIVNHIEKLDDADGTHESTGADVYFLDVPPGMVVTNASGYGADQLGVPPATAHAGRLMARARADGHVVLLSGVASGEAGADLALFDVTGRRLAGGHATASDTGETQLALPGALTSGIFFVRCADGSGVRSARFVFVR